MPRAQAVVSPRNARSSRVAVVPVGCRLGRVALTDALARDDLERDDGIATALGATVERELAHEKRALALAPDYGVLDDGARGGGERVARVERNGSVGPKYGDALAAVGGADSCKRDLGVGFNVDGPVHRRFRRGTETPGNHGNEQKRSLLHGGIIPKNGRNLV